MLYHLQKEANDLMIRCIKVNTNPASETFAPGLQNAVELSLQRLRETVDSKLNLSKLEIREQQISDELKVNLDNGKWQSTFRGRDVLRRFVGKYGKGIKYEMFRNLIIARMRDNGYQPEGMRIVLTGILEA